MQNNIKIAVIGGTGKSGKYLVQRLLSQAFATDLADFLIGQLFEEVYIRKAPFIANV